MTDNEWKIIIVNEICPFGGISVNVRGFLSNILMINDNSLLSSLLSMCKVTEICKGECVIQQGKVPSQIFFVVEGIFRGCISDECGKDITDCFLYESGQVLIANFDFDEPALISIEALVKSTVLCISILNFKNLIIKYPQLYEIYLKSLLNSSKLHWNLKILTYQYTAKQRYNWFLKNYPGMIEKISHKYIASFLNMTPVTLSRLIHNPYKI